MRPADMERTSGTAGMRCGGFLKQVAFNGDKIGLVSGGDEDYLVFHAKLPRAVDGVAGKHVGQRYALIGRRRRLALRCAGSALRATNFDAVQWRYLRKLGKPGAG